MPEPFPHQEPTGTIPPPDRPSEPTLPPPTEPSTDRRISPEDAAQAEAKKVQSWVETMDALEASVVDQGRFFAKFGEKSDDPNKDSRALVLIEPIIEPRIPPKKGILQKTPGTPEKRSWIVITRDGPKIITTHPEVSSFHPDTPLGHYDQIEDYRRSITEQIKNYASNPDMINPIYKDYELLDGYEIDRLRGDTEPTIHIFANFVPDARTRLTHDPALITRDANPEIVEPTIRRSIESSESPHKAKLEEATKSADQAVAIKDMIGSLPPRT